MNGVILMDKHPGISSSQYLNRIKKILKVSKAGHTGTLDPFASGLMTVCLNNATRIIPFINEEIKEYQAVMKFGEATDTMDCTGTVTDICRIDYVDKGNIERIVSANTGELEQIPPVYSAVKINGVRSYKLASKGVSVNITARKVNIENITILDYEYPYFRFKIRCSRGTYVRAWADSIGRQLGVFSHLTALRRIKSGNFKISNSYTLDDVEKGTYRIMDLNESLGELRTIIVDDTTALLLKNGINLKKYMLPEANIADINIGEYFKIMANDELIGIFVSLFSGEDIKRKDGNEVILKIKRILH